MATPLWTPGSLKQPGDLVRPTSSGNVVADGPDNPAFDEGDTGWTFSGNGSHTIDTNAPVFNGTYSAKLGWTDNPNAQSLFMTNDARLPVVPGQVVTLRCFVLSNIGGDYARLMLRINWYAAGDVALAPTLMDPDPTNVGGEARINGAGLSSAAANGVWVPIEITGVAPAGAETWTPAVSATWGDSNWTVDNFSWDYAGLEPPNNNLYRAVQSDAGFTGNTEPDWPTSIGLTVVDNEVTWECVSGTSVTWQAQRILVSGATEPTFPAQVNASVPDNTIAWTLNSRRVTDSRVPQSTIVALAASKVYAADDDIINYSATTNPLDWSTAEDAGFIPFGLQTYGANPVRAMGLYRGNLAAFNSQGCQVWQVDEDPRAITILDALPFGCTYPRSLAPVGNDLAFLTAQGIRSLGTAGAEVNLQGGYFGQQIDPLVVAAIAEAITEGWTPRGLYWPAQGQYWLFFGSQAFVLTIRGSERKQRSWARYTFPWEIDAWTIMGNDLYLRAGDLVEKVDPTALYDDLHDSGSGDVGDTFESVIQWPFLDFKTFNFDKELIGFDLSLDGVCSVSFGWDQRNLEYAENSTWTVPYQVDGDTVPGLMVGFSLTGPSFAMRLTIESGQQWKWYSANLYVNDQSQ